jgi:hypothetical protein
MVDETSSKAFPSARWPRYLFWTLLASLNISFLVYLGLVITWPYYATSTRTVAITVVVWLGLAANLVFLVVFLIVSSVVSRIRRCRLSRQTTTG